ncbi:protein-tyrosine phosphatase family protein [Microlunatus soli]|uniref:Protein-tyrosine phosphatase n=1 Tax=Microlunatus soli TaxID=630515 RepID=A0A1H1S616_9ACTN|nr:protein-tyrosine phosphatase family protein [Microlunatus soli]SDS43530.1 Protein-tyrosine phosphatase [Microlunatus soli]
MASTWDASMAGILQLPSGRLVRGRGLRRPHPPGATPEFGLYLLGKPAAPMPWETRWLRWPDFRLPTDPDRARELLHEVWNRSSHERVEIACHGGHGRTGTALACLAVLDGVSAADAVTYVRDRYHPRAVETPWQRRYVARFGRR